MSSLLYDGLNWEADLEGLDLLGASLSNISPKVRLFMFDILKFKHNDNIIKNILKKIKTYMKA